MSVLTIANMLGGEVAVGDPCSTASEVCTDSRSIKAGDMFIALRGERFDGHDYIIESMESVCLESWLRALPESRLKSS